ncbi:MAG: histidine--tRNA ligase, partial [Candidatus Nomurabacteria bacterium]|nr:histidine--tRNA ligase [Candidatus Nomurabacteria bacterium]
MTLQTASYKGARDLPPDAMDLRRYVFGVWRRVVERYGYREYATPLLEPLEMYAAKSGAEIVNDQTYKFEDRGGREVAIRPEMTPSVARIVAARRQEIALPARLYSIANFMRYERPQKGREREFWQLNFDLFGAEETAADAEIIQIGYDIWRVFGADDTMFTIKVNDRRLTDYLTKNLLGLNAANAAALIKLLDRKDKISPEVFADDAREILGGDAEKFAKLQQILSETDLTKFGETSQPLGEIVKKLRAAGLKNVKYDPTLVRGFDYYTGAVFEFFDEAPENHRAMCGGGRYDGLVGLFGVDDLPVVGMAPGETTTLEFLRAHNLLPKLNSSVDLTILP